VFAGLAAEATSERTFSYSGRAYGKQKRRMDARQLCAMVVGASCPWELTDKEVMAKYETRTQAAKAKAGK
jgi:hypothetical protein